MLLCRMASPKLKGRPAGQRPKEELMLQFKSKGSLQGVIFFLN